MGGSTQSFTPVAIAAVVASIAIGIFSTLRVYSNGTQVAQPAQQPLIHELQTTLTTKLNELRQTVAVRAFATFPA